MMRFSASRTAPLVAFLLYFSCFSSAQDNAKPLPEVKISGLSPGVHFEYFFLPRISSEFSFRYSSFSFLPVQPLRHKEMSRVHLALRIYPRNTTLGQFYIGVHGTYSHLFLGRNVDNEYNYYYYYYDSREWFKQETVGAGIEFGLKIPFGPRWSAEPNIGAWYIIYNHYKLPDFDSDSPNASAYYLPWNPTFPLDFKCWISVNYKLGKQ